MQENFVIYPINQQMYGNFDGPKPDSLKTYYRSNYLLQDIMRNFDKLNPQQCKVGTENGNKILLEIRRSVYIDGITIEQDVIDFHQLKCLYPEKYRHKDNEHQIKKQLKQCKWQLYCYHEGDFFSEHVDGKKGDRHFATFLLFPPAFAPNEFEGGDLIFKHAYNFPDEDNDFVVKPSTFQNWVAVCFKLDTVHEVTPVKTGKRFVFKTELELPYDNLYFENKIPAKEVKINFTEEIEKCKSLIEFYECKTKEYRKKLNLLERNISEKVNDLIDDIMNEEKNCCVVLDKFVADPSELTGEVALLFNEIISYWPYSSLRIIDTKHNRGDGSMSSCESKLEFDGYRKQLSPISDAKVFYWETPNSDSIIGKIRTMKSRYNDSTYDEIYKLSVSVICVQK